jgi:hypothetical protein
LVIDILQVTGPLLRFRQLTGEIGVDTGALLRDSEYLR